MDYRTTLVQTWKTIWKHKPILGFGFLPVVVQGLFALLIFGAYVFFPLAGLEKITSLIGRYSVVWMAIILVVMLLSIGSTAIAYAGILTGVMYANAGAELISFRKLWVACWPFVGRLAGMLLLIGFAISLIAILPALLGFLTAGLTFLCLLPFLFLIIPLSFLMQAGMSLGISAVVGDDLGVLAALRRTVLVFRSNFWPLVLMSLILYVLQTMVGFLISSPITIGQLLFMLLWWKNNSRPEFLFQIAGIFAMIVIPLILIVQGFFTTYIQSAWMLVYLGLTRSPQVANIIPIGDGG